MPPVDRTGSPRVVILGAGLAGISAAVRLAESGFDVEIIDKRPVLGGRASSFVPPGETERIDNCQHVLLGCCTNLMDLFRRTGTLRHFRFYNSYLFIGPRGTSRMGASALPPPLHLLPSLLRFKDMGWGDRWAVIRAMNAILRRDDRLPVETDEPFLDWLKRQGETPAAIENFWRVVLTSALNEDLERLSSRHAFKVFRDGFMSNRRGYRMGVPAVPLSELYSSRFLEEICTLRLASHIAGMDAGKDSVEGIRLQSGERRAGDFYISTLPPDSLRNVLPEGAAWPALERMAEIEWSPITGVHLWFDQPVTNVEHAAVIGRTIQWVFNRSAIAGQEARGPQYIQIVVSASRALMNMRRDDLLNLVQRELGELFPRAKNAKLVNAVVVKEARSTLSPRPGIDALRPGCPTPFRNLFLAGDWTATGWPFTMESAVRSGYAAAEHVAQAAGRPRSFLQPDLPASPLVRLAARLSHRFSARR